MEEEKEEDEEEEQEEGRWRRSVWICTHLLSLLCGSHMKHRPPPKGLSHCLPHKGLVGNLHGNHVPCPMEHSLCCGEMAGEEGGGSRVKKNFLGSTGQFTDCLLRMYIGYNYSTLSWATCFLYHEARGREAPEGE